MAGVAIFMVWAWECPVCSKILKDWKQEGCEFHAHQHGRECFWELPYNERPGIRAVNTTWVFNVVSDLDGDQQALVDSLDQDTGTRVL